jgi:hypothetical protein
MPTNISGSGLHLTLAASVTFPAGFAITAFADDGDPFDTPSVKIAESAMGLNGDLVTWSKASPTNVTINVIPGSDDDVNLRILAEANRAGKGKTLAKDVITLTGTYPDGKTITLSGGIITDYVPGDSVSSAGRKKSHPYVFSFEGVSRS